jgi:CAAX protease family protein
MAAPPGTLPSMNQAIAAVVATALAAALLLVQPWAGGRRYRRLVAIVDEHPEARMRHYRRGMAGEWAVVGVIVVIGLLAGRSARSIALVVGPHAQTWALIVAEVSVLLGATAALFRFGGPGIRDALRSQARGFAALLPHTGRERAAFALLALTAGICEEVIFRGFAIAYLRWLWPGAPELAVIALTAAGFGLAHRYQGLRGIITTGLVGVFLAWLVLSTGSLIPAMVLHALLDLRILALPDLGKTATTGPRAAAVRAADGPFSPPQL